LVSALLFLFLAGVSGWLIKLHQGPQSIPFNPRIGNRGSNVSALKEKGLPFSFLVVGDTHNSNTAKTLIEKALKEGDSSFLIILGDIVNQPDLWGHRFFLMEMGKEIKPSIPVFLVPGNHDIDYRSKIKEQGRRVTPEVYESLYGARNFYFIFNNCLFILCGIDGRNPAGYLDYLHETLSGEGGGKRHIFIFMHHPPRGVGMEASFALPNDKDFFTLLENYKVTTCFFGDYHAYWRGQTKETNLIVSGGGGGRLKKWQPKWGKFHHIMQITIDENRVNEGIMILPGEVSNFRRTLGKWMFINLVPALENKNWVTYFLLIVFSFWAIYSFVRFFNSLKERKRGK
jgi:hypothetical protein